MSFKDYYELQKQSHLKLRDQICENLEISKETFYNRLKENNWTFIEKQAVSDIVGIEIEELFTENTIYHD